MAIQVVITPHFSEDQWTKAFGSMYRFAEKVSKARGCFIDFIVAQTVKREVEPGFHAVGVEYVFDLLSPLGTFSDMTVQLLRPNYHQFFIGSVEQASGLNQTLRTMRGIDKDEETGEVGIGEVNFMYEWDTHDRMLKFHLVQWLITTYIAHETSPEEKALADEMISIIGKVE